MIKSFKGLREAVGGMLDNIFQRQQDEIYSRRKKKWKQISGNFALSYRQNCATNEIREYRWGSLTAANKLLDR